MYKVMHVPLKVKPNPLACQPLRHRTYSENPPGPAHISAKYSSSLGPTTSLYKQLKTEKSAVTCMFVVTVCKRENLQTIFVQINCRPLGSTKQGALLRKGMSRFS